MSTSTTALRERLTWWARDVRLDPRELIEIIGEELSGNDERVVGDIALRRLLLDTYQKGMQQAPKVGSTTC